MVHFHFQQNPKHEACFPKMSYKKLYYPMRCESCVASLHHAPCSLRLSVRQPRQGCLLWCSKKYTVATFCFKETHWQRGVSGEYEQTVECEMKDLERLRHLEDGLPVKVKYWTKERPSKCSCRCCWASWNTKQREICK